VTIKLKDTTMYRIVTIVLSISICFASDNIQSRMDKLKQSLQEKYQVYSFEDLQKLTSQPQVANRTFSLRDMDDLFGEWFVEEEKNEMYVTVGSDQSIPNMMQIMGYVEAEGSITATASDYETELTYILDPSILESGDDYNWACDDWDETEWYSNEEECNDACEAECYYDDDGGSGDENESGGFIMNFDIMGLFMMIFGFPPEGVENPVLIVFTLDSTNTIVVVEGLAFSENELVDLIADSADVATSAILDTVENNVTFTNLSLFDSTGTSAMSLNGTIGPEMIDLVAGVVTEIPMPMLDEEDDMLEVFMIFNEDSTGMEIYIEEDEWYGDMVDTSYFDWFATSDSLWLFGEYVWICDGDDYTDSFSSEEECNEECDTDCYYDEDNDVVALYYEFSDDTLFAGFLLDPCEEEGYDTYDECIEEGEMGLFLGDLEDIQDFYIHTYRVMLPTGDDVSLADVTVMPEKFTIHQNYPNPFNPVTTLRYELPEQTHVNITIYDMLGRKVKTLINQTQDAGYRSVIWDSTNNYGKPISAGIYLYQIQAGEYMQTKKMVLLK